MGRQLEQADLFEGLVIVHLKAYGLWYNMNHFRATGERSLLFKVQATSMYLINVPYIIFQLMYIYTTKFDLKKVTLAYLVVAPILITLCKQYFFFFGIRDICSLYDGIREDFLTSVPVEKRPQAHEIYRRTASRCNRLCLFACSGMLCTIVSWTIAPGYDADDSGSGRKKPLSGWYPFPASQNPWYQFVYVYEVFSTFWSGGTYSLYQLAILMPLICLCGHFQVLSYHIATLKKGGLNVKEGFEAFLNRELKAILKDYQKLIRYSDSLKAFYNVLVSVIITIGIANVTTVVLHLIFEPKDSMFMLKTCAFLSFQVIEVSLFCLCSSILETESSKIHHALYCNDWYLADKNFARTQQMMMIMASKPVTLTVMKMYTVNLETLLSILQFIYSTAAVLSKMN